MARPLRCRPLYARLVDDERGMGIVLAVSVTAIVFIFGATWAQMATHEVGISAVQRDREQALHAAEAGLHAAVSRLAQNTSLTSVGLTSLDQGGDVYGEYEVTITTPNPGVYPNRRLIDATGYSPRKAAPNERKRRLQVEVDLSMASGFDFALMASETAWTGTNTMEARDALNVTGDVFAAGTAKWGAGSTITGNVLSWGGADSRGIVQGTIQTAGNLPPGTVCPGSQGPSCTVWIRSGKVTEVWAADNPDTGTVEGRVDVMYSGPLGAGTDQQSQVTGKVVTATTPVNTLTTASPPYGSHLAIAPLPPPRYLLPTFSWASHKTGRPCTGTVHADTSAFKSYFQLNYLTPGISGCHEIVTAVAGTVILGGQDLLGGDIVAWNMSGDVSVYTDRPVKLDADILNPLGTPRKLVIVSTYSGGDSAVKFEGPVAIPSTVEVLIYAPNGSVHADAGVQNLRGSVYAKKIDLLDNFIIGEGSNLNGVPGFDWPNITYMPVQPRDYKEMPA